MRGWRRCWGDLACLQGARAMASRSPASVCSSCGALSAEAQVVRGELGGCRLPCLPGMLMWGACPAWPPVSGEQWEGWGLLPSFLCRLSLWSSGRLSLSPVWSQGMQAWPRHGRPGGLCLGRGARQAAVWCGRSGPHSPPGPSQVWLETLWKSLARHPSRQRL